MRAIILASTALLAFPLAAQTIAERLDKARTEVNTVENAAARAQTAIKAGNTAKATTEITAAKNAASRALYAIDRAIEAVKPPVEPPPIPPGDEFAPSLDGQVPIASPFDPALGLQTLSLTGQPKSAAPDVVGAFRFTCGFAGVGAIDPIVYPGQPGKSHRHQFYGATEVTSKSTYASLRKGKHSTCNYGDFPLNLSAYWQPTLEDDEYIYQPDHITIYYKRRAASDPACSDKTNAKYQGECVALPHGLKFIFGFDMLTMKAPTGSFDWICTAPETGALTAFKSLDEAAASGKCVVGGRLGTRGHAPACWDGNRTDSANHRDHVAYATVRNSTTGQYSCDLKTHPYKIPAFTLLSSWQIREGMVISKLRLSSDAMHPELPKGSTFHADFFMAHDPVFRDIWNKGPDSCIDGLLNCSSGVASRTLMLKNASVPRYPDATGKLVPNWYNPQWRIPIASVDMNKDGLTGFTY